MKQDKLVDSIGEIKDEFIEEARTVKKKLEFNWPYFRKVAISFACVALIVMIIPNIIPRAGKSADTYNQSVPKEEYSNDNSYSYNSIGNSINNNYDISENDYENSNIHENTKLIVTGYLHLETVDLDELLNKLQNSVNEYNGYIQSSSIYNNGAYRRYDATIRIPANKYQEFIGGVKESGNTTSYSEDIDDITTSYYDLEARINSLKAEEAKVLEFYKEATSIEELMLIEERLTEIRYEIDSKESQMKNYDLLTSYSTLNVSVEETKSYTETSTSFFTKLQNSFVRGWHNFVCSIEDFFIDLAYNIWTIVTVIIFGFIIFLIYKLLRNKKNKNK